MILRARIVLPLAQPPIDDGAVLIRDERIVAVRRWRDLAPTVTGRTADLGEVILLPGLINSHCHLDYTGLAGRLPPRSPFPDWIKAILALKAEWGYSEYAASWLEGARMLLRAGTTTVADIEAVPELLPQVWEATPLRVLSFLEMTGVRSRREPEAVLEETLARIAALPVGRCRASLSPHAPYSAPPRLFQLAAAAAAARGWRWTTHLAESAEEFEMFVHARGPMHAWLRRNERDMSDCGHGSPVRHLERLGVLAPNLLAVHLNYLAPGDAACLARPRVSVVHCPRSHAYFNHRPFPCQALLRAGVNLCLGTDSLATVRRPPSGAPALDLFAELRCFAQAAPGLPPAAILDLVTRNAARALGAAGQLGELAPDAAADLIAIPFAGRLEEAYPAVIHHPGEVAASLIAGHWAIPPCAIGAGA